MIICCKYKKKANSIQKKCFFSICGIGVAVGGVIGYIWGIYLFII